MRYVEIDSFIEPIEKCFIYFYQRYGKCKVKKENYHEYYIWKHPKFDFDTIKNVVKKAFKHASWMPEWDKHKDIYTVKNNVNVPLVVFDSNNSTLSVIKDY